MITLSWELKTRLKGLAGKLVSHRGVSGVISYGVIVLYDPLHDFAWALWSSDEESALYDFKHALEYDRSLLSPFSGSGYLKFGEAAVIKCNIIKEIVTEPLGLLNPGDFGNAVHEQERPRFVSGYYL